MTDIIVAVEVGIRSKGMIIIKKRKFILFFVNFVAVVMFLNEFEKSKYKSNIQAPKVTIVSIESMTDTTEVFSETTTDIATVSNNNNDIEIKQSSSETDMLLLAQLIQAEAGDECSYEHKMYVGQVVLNRIKDKRFPDTLKEVIYQLEPKQQYASIDNIDFYNYPSEMSINCAKQLLNGEYITTENIVWQAEFPQGEVVKIFDTQYSRTYIGK